jgi:hypothetical protein
MWMMFVSFTLLPDQSLRRRKPAAGTLDIESDKSNIYNDPIDR